MPFLRGCVNFSFLLEPSKDIEYGALSSFCGRSVVIMLRPQERTHISLLKDSNAPKQIILKVNRKQGRPSKNGRVGLPA